eukprot:512599-Pyramimonas_sp.AAC.1
MLPFVRTLSSVLSTDPARPENTEVEDRLRCCVQVSLQRGHDLVVPHIHDVMPPHREAPIPPPFVSKLDGPSVIQSRPLSQFV